MISDKDDTFNQSSQISGTHFQSDIMVSEDPAEGDSDSGDSLFVTQKPVPKAVRPARPARRRGSIRKSRPTCPTEPSSASHDGAKTRRPLKRYRFSFLSNTMGRLRSTVLFVQQSRSLNTHMVRGFLKAVSESTDDLPSSLPTVDSIGEDISPLTEEENEEASADEDIRVVDRKCFASKCKRKNKTKPLIGQTDTRDCGAEDASQTLSPAQVSASGEPTNQGDYLHHEMGGMENVRDASTEHVSDDAEMWKKRKLPTEEQEEQGVSSVTVDPRPDSQATSNEAVPEKRRKIRLMRRLLTKPRKPVWTKMST